MSQKAGAAKTTMAIHLAADPHAAGHISMIVKMDPRATASRWRGARGYQLRLARLGSAQAGAGRVSRAEFIVIDTLPPAYIMVRQIGCAANLILIPCQPQS